VGDPTTAWSSAVPSIRIPAGLLTSRWGVRERNGSASGTSAPDPRPSVHSPWGRATAKPDAGPERTTMRAWPGGVGVAGGRTGTVAPRTRTGCAADHWDHVVWAVTPGSRVGVLISVVTDSSTAEAGTHPGAVTLRLCGPVRVREWIIEVLTLCRMDGSRQRWLVVRTYVERRATIHRIARRWWSGQGRGCDAERNVLRVIRLRGAAHRGRSRSPPARSRRCRRARAGRACR